MELPVQISPSSLSPVYFNATGEISGSATELAGPEAVPDDTAILSVLQFGSISPPLSPWREVSRFMPGYRYESLDAPVPVPLKRDASLCGADLDGQADEWERILDARHERIIGDGPHPVVLFSGGVDSGLIAARLAARGYSDTILMNYSYDDDDPEAAFAEDVASRLGLRYERVSRDGADLCACLEEPGRVYAQPFSDPTTAEIWGFGQAVIQRIGDSGRPVLDGTASGVGTKVERWEKLLAVPRPIRSALGACHRFGIWSRPEKIDRTLRTARRSVTMSRLGAALGENALGGVLYEDGLSSQLTETLEAWLTGWAGSEFPRLVNAGSLGFMALNCLTARTHGLLADSGVALHLPFAGDEGLALQLDTAVAWKSPESKAPLKRALARLLPDEIVYRAKDGFSDPKMRVLFEPEFIEYLRAAAEPGAPIAHMLDRRMVAKACKVLESGHLPGLPVHRCLWGMVFLDRWYRSAR